MRRPVKHRDALDLVREWLACNRVELCVVELTRFGTTDMYWRTTLRTALGRERSGYGTSPARALSAAYTGLGYRFGDRGLELSEAAA